MTILFICFLGSNKLPVQSLGLYRPKAMLLEVKVYAIGGENQCYCNCFKDKEKHTPNNRGMKGLLDVLNEKWSEER